MTAIADQLHRLILHRDQQRYALQTGPGAYPLQDRDLSLATLEKHIAGELTIGARLVQPGSALCTAGCVDIDTPRDAQTLRDAYALAQTIQRVGEARGLNLYLEFSGRRGFHVWLFSDRPLPGTTMIGCLKALTQMAGFHAKELFPSGATADKEQKSIKLPCGIHKGTGHRAGFLEPGQEPDWTEDGLPHVPELQQLVLEKLEQTPTGAIVALAQKHLETSQTKPKNSDSTQNLKKVDFDQLLANSHPGCIQRMLERGCPVELDYNSANVTLARYANTKELTDQAAIAMAQAMAENTPDDHPTQKGQTERVANFRKAWKSVKRNRAGYQFGCSFALAGLKISDKQALADRGCTGEACPLWPYGQAPAQAAAGHAPRLEPEKIGEPVYFYIWKAIASLTEQGVALTPATILDALERLDYDALHKDTDYLAVMAWSTTEADSHAEREALASLLQDCDRLEEALALDIPAAGFVHKVCLEIYGDDGEVIGDERLEEVLPRLLAECFKGQIIDPSGYSHVLQRIRDTGLRVLASYQADQGKEAYADRTLGFEDTLDQVMISGASLLRRANSEIAPMEEHSGALLAELFSKPNQAIATPSPWLNHALNGGYQPGKLYVVGAPPAAGKSTFCSWCGDHAAVNRIPVLYASYEMGKEQLWIYSLARLSGINSAHIEGKKWLDPTYRDRKTLQAEVIAAAEKYQQDVAPWVTVLEAGPEHTAAKLKGAIAQVRHNLELTEDDPVLVIVDYLQLLLTGDEKLDNSSNETIRISRIATALKQVARDSKAAVVAISDITKAAYMQAVSTGSLDMSALRDSFKIAHSADTIFLLQTGAIKQGKGDQAVTKDQLTLWAENLGSEQQRLVEQARQQNSLHKATKDQYCRLSLIKNRGGTKAEPLFVYQKALHRFQPLDLENLAQTDPEDF